MRFIALILISIISLSAASKDAYVEYQENIKQLKVQFQEDWLAHKQDAIKALEKKAKRAKRKDKAAWATLIDQINEIKDEEIVLDLAYDTAIPELLGIDPMVQKTLEPLIGRYFKSGGGGGYWSYFVFTEEYEVVMIGRSSAKNYGKGLMENMVGDYNDNTTIEYDRKSRSVIVNKVKTRRNFEGQEGNSGSVLYIDSRNQDMIIEEHMGHGNNIATGGMLEVTKEQAYNGE